MSAWRALAVVALLAACKGTLDPGIAPPDLLVVDLVPGPDACPATTPMNGGDCSDETAACSYGGSTGACACVGPEDKWVCCPAPACDPTPPTEGSLCCAAQTATWRCSWCSSDGTFVECDCAPADHHWRCMGASCMYPAGTDGATIVDGGLIEAPDAGDGGA